MPRKNGGIQNTKQFVQRTIQRNKYWECTYCGTCLRNKGIAHTLEHCRRAFENMKPIGNPKDAVFLRGGRPNQASFHCLACNESFQTNLGEFLDHFRVLHAESHRDSAPPCTVVDTAQIARLRTQKFVAGHQTTIQNLKTELGKAQEAKNNAIMQCKIEQVKNKKIIKTYEAKMSSWATEKQQLRQQIQELQSEKPRNKKNMLAPCRKLDGQLNERRHIFKEAIASVEDVIQNTNNVSSQMAAMESCVGIVVDFVADCHRIEEQIDSVVREADISVFMERVNQARAKSAHFIELATKKEASVRARMDKLRDDWSTTENCYEWTFERFLNYVCVTHPDLYARNQRVLEGKWRTLPGFAMESINVPLIHMSGITGSDCEEIIMCVREIAENAEPGADGSGSDSDDHSVEEEGAVTCA